MDTYRKFSDLLNNNDSCGSTPTQSHRVAKAVNPAIYAEATLDGLGTLGGVLPRIQDSPSNSMVAKADETAVAREEAGRDGDFGNGAVHHLNHLNQLDLPQSRGNTPEDPGASVEHGIDTPRDWGEGFAGLDPDRAPANVPAVSWRTFVDDVRRFLDGGWAEKAVALGWGSDELFGACRDRPFARLDKQGLCWFIKGGRLVGLSNDAAVIETCSGARHTYRRKPT